MAYAPLNDVTLVAKPLAGQAQVASQVRQIATAEVAQLHALQVVPDAFIRIQIRRIAVSKPQDSLLRSD